MVTVGFCDSLGWPSRPVVASFSIFIIHLICPRVFCHQLIRAIIIKLMYRVDLVLVHWPRSFIFFFCLQGQEIILIPFKIGTLIDTP